MPFCLDEVAHADQNPPANMKPPMPPLIRCFILCSALLPACCNKDEALAGSTSASASASVGTAPSGITDLVRDLEDENKRRMAARQLASSGPDAAPPLQALLRDSKNVQACIEAVRILQKLGASGVPGLLTALEHDNYLVRQHAASSLEKMGPEAKLALPKLKELAEKDTDSTVRAAAEKTIQRFER